MVKFTTSFTCNFVNKFPIGQQIRSCEYIAVITTKSTIGNIELNT